MNVIPRSETLSDLSILRVEKRAAWAATRLRFAAAGRMTEQIPITTAKKGSYLSGLKIYRFGDNKLGFAIINIVFKIPIYEMYVFLISTLIVLTLEVINTAFERMVDKLMPSKNNNAKIIKDYLAGSVLISGIFFFVIEFIILISNK